MTLKPARDPKQPAGRNWAAVDPTIYSTGSYCIDGHPIVELRRDLRNAHSSSVYFFARRADVEAALQLLQEKRPL